MGAFNLVTLVFVYFTMQVTLDSPFQTSVIALPSCPTILVYFTLDAPSSHITFELPFPFSLMIMNQGIIKFICFLLKSLQTCNRF